MHRKISLLKPKGQSDYSLFRKHELEAEFASSVNRSERNPFETRVDPAIRLK